MYTTRQEVKQGRFADAVRGSKDIVSALRDEMQRLQKVSAAMSQSDPRYALDMINRIDFQLLRHSLQSFRVDLAEVARNDCALLIAGSVLDTSHDNQSAANWISWLSAGPSWPKLAMAEWPQSVEIAKELVLQGLEDAGFNLSRKSTREIQSAVAGLEITDLLSAEDFGRFFLAEFENEEQG